MTLDELIKQLNKIKEIYPDSGKWIVFTHNEEFEGTTIEGRRDGLLKVISVKKNSKNELVIE